MGDLQWIGIIGATILAGAAFILYASSWEPERPEEDHGRLMAKLGEVVEHARRIGQ